MCCTNTWLHSICVALILACTRCVLHFLHRVCVALLVLILGNTGCVLDLLQLLSPILSHFTPVSKQPIKKQTKFQTFACQLLKYLQEKCINNLLNSGECAKSGKSKELVPRWPTVGCAKSAMIVVAYFSVFGSKVILINAPEPYGQQE